MSEVTNCNQCHNACKLDEVKCGRGERFRDYIQSGGNPEEYVPKRDEGHDEKRGHGRHGEHDHAEGGKRHGKHGGHHHHHQKDYENQG